MLKVMTFTAIKQHLAGDYFAAANVAPNLFYLTNSQSILVGVNGDEFEFKSESNASMWIEANILRVNKQREQDLANLLSLEQKNAIEAHDWLSLEVQTIQERNQGLWGDAGDEVLEGGSATG